MEKKIAVKLTEQEIIVLRSALTEIGKQRLNHTTEINLYSKFTEILDSERKVSA